jgi:hypothetical protein
MATNDTDVTICSSALNYLGENTISSFSDGTTQAGICQPRRRRARGLF